MTPTNLTKTFFLAVVFGMFALRGTAQTWTQSSTLGQSYSIASSADGAQLVAATSPGMIYTSTNFGSIWTPTSAPQLSWSSVASSANGTVLLAAAGDKLFLSRNAARTWTEVTPTNFCLWDSVAVSALGDILAAASAGSPVYTNAIYVSTNSGASWTKSLAPAQPWLSVAISADGARLAASFAGYPNGAVYISTDYGLNWSSNHISSDVFDTHFAIACSASGRTLLTISQSGLAFESQDWGATWTNVLALPYLQSGSVACSADGITLAVVSCAVGSPTTAFVSTNSGVNWSGTQLNPYTNFGSVICSADGTKLAVALAGAGTYAWQRTPSPMLCLAPLESEIRLSWTLPSRTFLLQQSPAATLDQWKLLGAIPVLNYTNMQYQISFPKTNENMFYRLVSD